MSLNLLLYITHINTSINMFYNMFDDVFNVVIIIMFRDTSTNEFKGNNNTHMTCYPSRNAFIWIHKHHTCMI
jgi:hypothetical protein